MWNAWSVSWGVSWGASWGEDPTPPTAAAVDVNTIGGFYW